MPASTQCLLNVAINGENQHFLFKWTANYVMIKALLGASESSNDIFKESTTVGEVPNLAYVSPFLVTCVITCDDEKSQVVISDRTSAIIFIA